MTVGELIGLLEAQDEDAEVRVATQPHYPLESKCDGITPVEDDGKPVVYIVEGSQLGYAPRSVWDEVIEP